MRSLDTNVLARFFVDDADDAQAVKQRPAAVAALSERAYVSVTVLLELEWVLRSRYAIDKPTVLTTFTALLETQELELQFEAALERALHLYRQGAAEFADCLHAGLSEAAAQSPLLTFHSRAARLDGVHLIGRLD